MAMLRVDARPLLPRLRAELAALLGGLSERDWLRDTACPSWTVHDVACHLLGVELGNVSVRRDGWALGPGGGEDPGAWLNAFNQQWVAAMRRVSPRSGCTHVTPPPRPLPGAATRRSRPLWPPLRRCSADRIQAIPVPPAACARGHQRRPGPCDLASHRRRSPQFGHAHAV
jgi:Mycothiol maleylpyruvate isomerase N-terminal domain